MSPRSESWKRVPDIGSNPSPGGHQAPIPNFLGVDHNDFLSRLENRVKTLWQPHRQGAIPLWLAPVLFEREAEVVLRLERKGRRPGSFQKDKNSPFFEPPEGL